MKQKMIIIILAVLGFLLEGRAYGAMVNDTCPYAQDGSTQTGVAPWDWNGMEWSTNLQALTSSLGGLIPVPGLSFAFKAGSSIWKVVNNELQSSNAIHQVMKAVYALVEKEIDSTELGHINGYLDDMADSINKYQNDALDGRCKHLQDALSYAIQAKNEMNEYSGKERIFLPSLLQVGTMHLSILRDMALYGADNHTCCDQLDGVCTYNPQYVDDQVSAYNFYYKAFLTWLPDWYSWRMGELSYYKSSGDYYFEDKYTSQVCKFKDTNNNGWNTETRNVVEQELVGGLMATLKPFVYLHQFIVGNETVPAQWPDAKADYPLTVYREGIWTGTYRGHNNCGQSGTKSNKCTFLGGHVSGHSSKNVQDEPGIITKLYVSAYNTIDYMKATYSTHNGKSIPVDDPNNNKKTYVVDNYSEDGWIQWVHLKALWGATNEQLAWIQPAFNNSKDDVVVAEKWGGHNHPFLDLNLTMGPGWFLAGLKYTGPSDGPSGTEPVGGIGGYFLPLEFRDTLEASAATAPSASYTVDCFHEQNNECDCTNKTCSCRPNVLYEHACPTTSTQNSRNNDLTAANPSFDLSTKRVAVYPSLGDTPEECTAYQQNHAEHYNFDYCMCAGKRVSCSTGAVLDNDVLEPQSDLDPSNSSGGACISTAHGAGFVFATTLGILMFQMAF